MAFFGVTVEEIETVWSHPNADRLQLAKMKGLAFQFVVMKDQYLSGDKVIYFPIDSLLPSELSLKLGVNGKLSGKDKNRVKTIRLRNEISQGLVIPVLDVIPEAMIKSTPEEITSYLGVEKYEQPVNVVQDGILKELPPGLSVYDIEGADRFQYVVDLMMDMDVSITEKMEGTNFSISKINGELFVNQRNNTIIQIEGKSNSFWAGARDLGLIDYVMSRTEDSFTLYGELCGPKIQGNLYGLKNFTIFLFDAKIDRKWVPFDQFESLVKDAGFSHLMAPVLFKGKLATYLNGMSVQEASNGLSVKNDKVAREGIVINPLIETYFPKFGGRLIIKQRSPAYLAQSDN